MTFAFPVLAAFPTHTNSHVTRRLNIGGVLKKATGHLDVLSSRPVTLGGTLAKLTGAIDIDVNVSPSTTEFGTEPILTTDAFATTEPGSSFEWAYSQNNGTRFLPVRIPDGDPDDKIYIFVYRRDTPHSPVTPTGFTLLASANMTIAGFWAYSAGVDSSFDPSLHVIDDVNFINIDLETVSPALAYVVRIGATEQSSHFVSGDSNVVDITASAVFTELPATSIFFAATTSHISSTPASMTEIGHDSNSYLHYEKFFHGSGTGSLSYGIDGGRRAGWLLTFDGVWDPTDAFATTESYPLPTTEGATTTEPPGTSTTEVGGAGITIDSEEVVIDGHSVEI